MKNHKINFLILTLFVFIIGACSSENDNSITFKIGDKGPAGGIIIYANTSQAYPNRGSAPSSIYAFA